MGQGSGESDFSEKSPEESVESGPPSRAEKGAELRQTEGEGPAAIWRRERKLFPDGKRTGRAENGRICRFAGTGRCFVSRIYNFRLFFGY